MEGGVEHHGPHSDVLVPVVHRLVGGDRDREELPGELQQSLVLEDDGTSVDACPFDPEPVDTVDIVTWGDLK